MANYPSPCDKCENKHNCTRYKTCQPWLTRYRYRQQQINAYANKVLPDYYKRLAEQEKKKETFNCAHLDKNGFCQKYSTYDADLKCPGNGDCDGYMEAEDD